MFSDLIKEFPAVISLLLYTACISTYSTSPDSLKQYSLTRAEFPWTVSQAEFTSPSPINYFCESYQQQPQDIPLNTYSVTSINNPISSTASTVGGTITPPTTTTTTT